jgi:hypothetical protein
MGSVLLVEGADQLDDLGGQTPLAGLQDPTLGVSEAGEVEGQELLEGALGLVEAGLELPRRGPQGRDGDLARAGQGAARVAQQRLVGGGVGRGAPGGEEGLGLARAQAVAREGVGQTLLIAARQGRQSGGRGGREAAVVDVAGQVGGEPTAERETAIHPGPAAAEQRGDVRGGQVIVVGQRADHAGLVHGAQGPPRRVGVQQAGLGHDAGGVLDHHGHVRVAVAGPVGEALEAVEHLVGAVAGRGHAQGQRSEGAGRIGARPPQRRERRGEPIDRELEHERHGRAASRGRSWESG